MKIVNFDEEKAKKNGELTPKALIEDLLEQINSGNVEQVVYVVKYKDGEVDNGYSHLEQTTVIGLLECGKQLVFDHMYEN